jgi:TP901 family phage tail tape measure protein
MADVNANIDINIDSSNALAQLKALQRQISQFHTSIAKSSEAAALAQRGLQKNLLNSINAIGSFTAEMRTVKTSAESFTNSLEKNKFSMREYFRYAGASTKTFGRLFRSEFDTIGKVAEERVKRLQTQYIKMGRDTNGAMKAIAVMPTQLNMNDYTTKVQLAAQKQALFNQLMKQGSTNLLNFGKNTQWAGRQLMVGFTLPLMAVGTAATKTFMDMEAQALRFKKVYGDLFTPQEETQRALDNITELGKQFTKYGVAVSTTVGLAAEAAAAGFSGLDLQRQTTEATRLSILGQVDSQKALETTISLQNAFGMSSEKLADSINFLNAVENQTVVSLDDITTAIPKVAPVIQQLGGDVKDLAFFMAAMKEGGINASEGANALKSGLAALINPTKKASDMLASYGINATAIVEKNKGDLKATVIGFAQALNQLDPLARARAIEQMFGKFQFARLSTLFANVARDGNQAARVLNLANSSVEELSALSEKELGMTAESSMNKFKKTVEDLKVALIPVGQAFLEAVTPILEFVGGVLEKFANLSSGTKRLITLLTVGLGAVGPVLLMTFGLLANGIANIIKLFLRLRMGYQTLTGQSQILGEQTQYMTSEQLDAAAAAHSLNQTHATLTQTFTAEVGQINKLIAAYNSAAGAARNFAMNNPGMMMPGRAVRKFASGIVSVPGPKGAGDIVPAMLSPGEAVIPTKIAKKYAPLIQGMIADNIPGYQKGRSLGTAVDVPGGMDISHFGMKSSRTGAELLAMITGLETTAANNVRKMVESFEDGLTRVFTTFDNQVVAQFTEINRLMQTQGKASTQRVKQNLVGAGFAETRDIELQRQLISSGTSIDEFKLINKQITSEIIKGFDTLGDKTEITSEELNNLLRKAYEEVAKTDARVEKAYNNMKQVSTVFDPDRAGVRGSRIPITEESYVRQKKSTQRTPSQYRKMQGQMVGPENIPYPQSSRFVVTHNVAKELGITSRQAAEIYNKMSIDAKTTLSRMRNDLTAFKKEFIIEAAKVGEMVGTSAVNATAKAAGTASPSRKTRRTGEDIGRGLEEGMRSRQDDVVLAGSQLGKAATTAVQGGVGKIPFSSPSQPGFVAGNISTSKMPGVALSEITEKARRNREQLLATQQLKRTQALGARMNSLNKAFMGGTFALSALSGVASMAGGNLGKFSQILFQITGPLFALSSILQLFTGQKIIGIIKNIGKLKFGVAAIALTGFVVATKLINDARKKELEYIYGLSNAMKTTTQQVKTLGDFFGIVPTKLPIDLKNREVVRKETRSARDRLRADEGFQKEFAPTIKTLSAATAEEARLAFTTLALNLKAQGFAEQQVQTIVDALREEAGKTSIKLDVKSLNFSAESIKGIQTQIAPIILSLEKNLMTGPTGAEGLFKRFKNSFLQAYGGKTPGSLDTMSNAAKKSLSELSTTISSVSNSAAGMFKLGLISADDFEATMFGILETTKSLSAENQKLVLMEIFKSLNVDAAPFLANLKGAVLQMQTLALISSGVLDKDSGIFKLLASKDYEDQQRGRKALIKLYDETIGAINKVVQADKNAEDAANAANNAAGKTNPLKERIKAIQNQTNAYIILRNAKVDEATATELSNDAEIASLVIANSKGKSLKQIIALINEYKAAIKGQTDAELKYMEKPNLFKKQLEQYQAQANLRDKIIDIQFASKIKAENDALKIQEENLQKVNDEIQKITNSQIKPIQAIIDANNFALESISLQEDTINQTYNTQIEALDKIATINQDIANIQKQRLSIADALTRGDISAAAQLAQEARAEQAQSAVSTQKDALTSSRDSQIAALGRVNLEKQNKELQLQISKIERDKLLTLQTQKETIESSIEATNRSIQALNSQVDKLKNAALYAGQTKTDIDSLAELIDAAEKAGIPFNDLLLSQAGSAAALAKSLSDAVTAQKSLASLSGLVSGAGPGTGTGTGTSTGTNTGTSVGTGSTVTVKSGNTLSGIAKAAGVSLSDVIKSNPQITNPNLIKPGQIIKIPGKMYGGKIKSMNMGGMVPKYLARGGGIGSDTVPAMLTPGEFVMNRRATEQFGPLLSMLNESKYPSMIGNRAGAQMPVNNVSTSMNDNSTAVYNYNLGFSINGTNSNANDIARAVMKEIKNVDSQRVRGQRI